MKQVAKWEAVLAEKRLKLNQFDNFDILHFQYFVTVMIIFLWHWIESDEELQEEESSEDDEEYVSLILPPSLKG